MRKKKFKMRLQYCIRVLATVLPNLMKKIKKKLINCLNRFIGQSYLCTIHIFTDIVHKVRNTKRDRN